MTQYINKDALVAEIQGYISGYKDILSKVDEKCLKYAEGIEAKIDILQHLLSFLDTLEVKGVDLEEEFYDFLDTLIGKDNGHLSEDELFRIAEYFFQLGLNAQKGE